MIRLTDAFGNECWIRADQIKAMLVVTTGSGEEERRLTEIRFSVEKDGFSLVVLENPGVIARRIRDAIYGKAADSAPAQEPVREPVASAEPAAAAAAEPAAPSNPIIKTLPVIANSPEPAPIAPLPSASSPQIPRPGVTVRAAAPTSTGSVSVRVPQVPTVAAKPAVASAGNVSIRPTVGGIANVATVAPGAVPSVRVAVPRLVPSLHIAKGGKDIGAVEIPAIRALLERKELSLRDLYFNVEQDEWVALKMHPEFAALA